MSQYIRGTLDHFAKWKGVGVLLLDEIYQNGAGIEVPAMWNPVALRWIAREMHGRPRLVAYLHDIEDISAVVDHNGRECWSMRKTLYSGQGYNLKDMVGTYEEAFEHDIAGLVWKSRVIWMVKDSYCRDVRA